MKGSILIVFFFILGIVFGHYQWIPYNFSKNKLSFYILCSLMYLVGISLGNDSKTLKGFRTIKFRLLLLPITTIIGTLLGCTFISFLLPYRTVADCMAVGSGFGYYSLSSIFITEYKGAELGTIALVSNIMREVMALLLNPLNY